MSWFQPNRLTGSIWAALYSQRQVLSRYQRMRWRTLEASLRATLYKAFK